MIIFIVLYSIIKFFSFIYKCKFNFSIHWTNQQRPTALENVKKMNEYIFLIITRLEHWVTVGWYMLISAQKVLF